MASRLALGDIVAVQCSPNRPERVWKSATDDESGGFSIERGSLGIVIEIPDVDIWYQSYVKVLFSDGYGWIDMSVLKLQSSD